MPAMDSPQPSPAKAYLALALAVIILGFSAILVSYAEAPGTVIGFYRMAIGALVLAPLFVRRLLQGADVPRRGLLLSILAGLFFGGDLAAWMTAIRLGGATLPTLFVYTSPLWVGLGAGLIFKQRLARRFWWGVVIAMLGTAIVIGLGDAGSGNRLGALLGLVAGLSYAGFFLAAQSARQHLDALTFFWVATLSTALLLLVVNLAAGLPLGGFAQPTWVNLMAQGVVVQAAGWMLVSYAQGHLPASLVSPTMLGQPVLTAVLAGPLLGQYLSAQDVLGGLIVLAGILIVHLSHRAAKPEAH